jgi:hypothetical protein
LTDDERTRPVSQPTPAEKLLIKPGTAVWMSHPERITILEPWPNDTSQVGDVARAGVALLFADDVNVLRRGLDRALTAVRDGSSLWVVHPGHPDADAMDLLTPTLGEYRLGPIEHLQLDPVWAALRVERAV